MQMYQIVAGIIRRDAEMLLVQQQSKRNPKPNWSLPGGKIEAGELLNEALIREIREETGLIVDAIGPLAWVTQHDNRAENLQSLTLVFEINAWHGELNADDPDDVICAVEFVSFEQAHMLLESLPWRDMREPLQAYLNGTNTQGSIWCYRTLPDNIINRTVTPISHNDAMG